MLTVTHYSKRYVFDVVAFAEETPRSDLGVLVKWWLTPLLITLPLLQANTSTDLLPLYDALRTVNWELMRVEINNLILV